MRIFVTGGSGYIGGAVIKELKARGHHVAALVRNDAASAKVRALGAEPVHGAIHSLDVIELAAREHDATIFMAGYKTAEDIAAEAEAIEKLHEIAKDDHVMVYTSGGWVYGDRGDAIVDEKAPIKPVELVAWRPAHEELVLAGTAKGIRSVVIRPAVVFGDGGGIVGMLVAQGAKGPVTVVGDGNNRWPMVRIDAIADLYAVVTENASATGIYNAVQDAAVPYVEIARAASRNAGGDGSVAFVPLEEARKQMGPFADALVIDLQMSGNKAKLELGWDPKRPTVIEELSDTVVP